MQGVAGAGVIANKKARRPRSLRKTEPCARLYVCEAHLSKTLQEETTARSPQPEAAHTATEAAPAPAPAPNPSATPSQNPQPDRPAATQQPNLVAPARRDRETMEDFATALETFTAEAETQTESRIHKGTVLKITHSLVVLAIGS